MVRTRRSLSLKDEGGVTELAESEQNIIVLRKRKASALTAQSLENGTKVVETIPTTKKELEKTQPPAKKMKSSDNDQLGNDDEKMEKKQSSREEFLEIMTMIGEKKRETYLKIRLGKLKKENGKLDKDYDVVERKVQKLSKSINSLRECTTGRRAIQSHQEKILNETEEQHKKNSTVLKEMQEKDRSQSEKTKILEQKEKKMDSYNKMKSANNTALLHEASRLKDDNIRLKGNISNVLMNIQYGMMTGRV